ncbi:MAG: radical SAM protein [Proteobacteria bacterium]|nr:radical SAM protein [Pseudomonadota bacterium]
MFRRKILVNIEATPSCPASCSMCPRDQIADHGYISLDTMEKIVAQIESDYVWEVDLAGRGEPTIHPQFHELLQIMEKADAPTNVTTTGVTFTEKNIRACVDHVDVIRLSVSSIHKSTFDQVHIGLKFDKIWRNIAALAEAAADKVIVHLTGGPVIYDHLPETVEHLRGLGYSELRLLPLWNRGGDIETSQHNRRRKELMECLEIAASESEYSTGIGKFKLLFNMLAGKVKNRQYCAVGDGSISISYKGEIMGCFQDFGHTSNIGHIDSDDLRTIMRTRVRQLGRMNVCEDCNSNKVALPFAMFASTRRKDSRGGDGKRHLPVI